MNTTGSASSLGVRVRSLWAKSDLYLPDSQNQKLSLVQHLADTAGVAGRIWDEFLPPSTKRFLGKQVGSEEAARVTTVFVAAVHDVGKASPSFQVKVPSLAESSADLGLHYETQKLREMAPGTTPRHEVVGYWALFAYLRGRYGTPRKVACQYAMLVGAHHGAPPDDARLNAVYFGDGHYDEVVMGDAGWSEVQDEFIRSAMSSTGFDELAEAALPDLSGAAQTLISAIVIMADWIASNTRYFPLVESGDTTARVDAAWRELALPKPWTTPAPPSTAQEQLRTRFGLPEGANPRPIQEAARAAAEAMQEPGLMIVEANMGEGKTEAALMAAEVLMHRFDLGGVFMGLPTQATTNAMFSRAVTWLEHLDANDGGNRATVFLAHGKRDLNDDYQPLRKDAWAQTHRPQDLMLDREESGPVKVVVHDWLSDRKRGLLAPFVIGTIDQVLMASLKARHVMLRQLGLAGKVVILDEVHAVDAYMNVYLEGALEWLGAMHVPVIMLSATLPLTKRQAFVSAYERGRSGLAVSGRRRAPTRNRTSALEATESYPLITSTAGATTATCIAVDPGKRHSSLRLRALAPDDVSLGALVRDRGRHGGRVAVLRNTVARAQHTYALLQELFPDAEVVLAHARFLAVDRAERDRELLRRFGRGAADLADGRLQILVATQVAEQSLDLDMDLMVSDLAPVDLLLQRAGRLHRHDERDPDRPEPMREAELWITGVDWRQEPPAAHRSYLRVYEEYLLLRTLLALDIHPKKAITTRLPTDIPRLVGAVYDGDPDVPSTWHQSVEAAKQAADTRSASRSSSADAFRLASPSQIGDLRGLIAASGAEAESSGGSSSGVRDGMDSVEILVVQRVDGEIRVPSWHPERPGALLPTDSAPDVRDAQAVRTCSISVTIAMLNRGKVDVDTFIRELETLSPVRWESSYQLAGELVLALDAEQRATVCGLDFSYSQETGMEVSEHD